VLPWAPVNNLGNLDFQSGASFVVGVWSYGPDGQPNTGDDITTWPEDVERSADLQWLNCWWSSRC
jgi:hypothetical protein